MTRKTWQSDHPRIRDQPIEELCFPGTHHAAMYDEDAADWWYTQTRDVYTQLNDGIRFFDVRVEAKAGVGAQKFYGHHGGDPSRQGPAGWDIVAETGAPLNTVFGDVRQFLGEVADQGATELLVFKLSRFWESGSGVSDEFESEDWDDLEALLRGYFGTYLLDRSEWGEWSDLIATTSLSDFDGPRVAVLYQGGRTPDFAWDKEKVDDEWQGDWLEEVRPGDIYREAMAEDLGALGWMVTADGSKIIGEYLEAGIDGVEPFVNPFWGGAYEDEYDDLREAATKLNELLGGVVAEAKVDPGKRPRFIMLDYYETSNVVEYARELSVLGVNNGTPGDVPPVSEAVYTIRSRDSGDVVEVEDGWWEDPDDDGTDVEEEEYRGDADQRWKLLRNDDGTYRLENDYSGKVLEVERVRGVTIGDPLERTVRDAENDIHQWEWDGGDNQRWYVVPLPDGNYCFLNKRSGKVIDGANPGDNVHQHEWHGYDNQRWALEKRREIRSDPIQPSLYHVRRSGFYGEFAVVVADSSTSNGANVEVGSEADAPGQLFSFEPLDDGTYKIVNVHSGKVVDGYWPEDGTDIHQYEWHGGDNQRWYLQDIGDGEYALVNKASRLVLDAHGGLVDGENVRQDEWDDRRNHRWEIDQPESARVEETVYQLESVDSGLVADVEYMSDEDGANVWMWEDNDTGAQKFRFVRLDDGTYKVVNVHSGNVVDGYWPRDGRDVHQYGWHGGDNQRWYVYDVGDGAYALVNEASGRVLDASGPNKKANVHQWEWHGGDNQRWLLDQV